MSDPEALIREYRNHLLDATGRRPYPQDDRAPQMVRTMKNRAAFLRSLKGRIDLPAIEEWTRAEERVAAIWGKE